MGRKLSFLGFLTYLFVFAFSANSFAGTCTYVYDSCNAGYYLDNDYCEDCPNGCTCAGGDAQPVCCGTENCPSGYTDGPNTYNSCNEDPDDVCYADCEVSCVMPPSMATDPECPSNATCEYENTTFYGGRFPKNPSVCDLTVYDNTLERCHVTSYTCNAGYEDGDGGCSSCSDKNETETDYWGEDIDGGTLYCTYERSVTYDSVAGGSCEPEYGNWYIADSNDCSIDCDAGYEPDGLTCASCPDNSTTKLAELATVQITGGNKYCQKYEDTTWSSDGTDCVSSTQERIDYNDCEIVCSDGYYEDGDGCTICPAGSYCTGGDEFSCSDETNGEFPYSDQGTSSKDYCYRDCIPDSPDIIMTGRDYYNATDTCQITACPDGQYLDNGDCVECPAGSYCTGGEQFICNTQTNGEFPNSASGSDSIDDCYRTENANCEIQYTGAIPSGCSGAQWDNCECSETGTYKLFHDNHTEGTTTYYCQQQLASVTAATGHFVDGLTCPSCITAGDGSYTQSAGGNIGSGSCYKDCPNDGATYTGHDYLDPTNPDQCDISACPDGQYLENGTCVQCPSGSYCTGGERFDCPASHPDSDPGISSKNYCYTECAVVSPVATMSGRDYYGVADTCEITSCVEGYYLENGTCVICPTGSYCDGTGKFNCSETTNGTHPDSDQGAKEIGECYTDCQLASHATSMGGHDYYDDNLDNCVVVECEPDYYPNDAGTACVKGTHTCAAGKTENGANCPVGHYCPARDDVAGDCEIACPADSLGGTVTTDGTGKANITDCYTTRTCVAVDGGAADRISYYLGTAANGSYSDDRKTTVTYCTAGYYRATDDATSCSPVGTGAWSPDRANQNTCSDANSLVRTLCSTLSGADATITTDSETSGSPAACYNTCPDELIVVDGEVIGKKVPAQEQVYYNGTTIPACTYPDNKIECEDGYTPSGSTCVPSVFTITLDHNCNNACTNTPASPIYLRYNTGWYANLADANAGTNPITSVNAPNWPGNTFSGYFAGATQVITANGGLTTNYKVFKANTTIAAGWGQNDTITCPAGTYYSGTGTTCTDCPAGSYCEGTTVVQDTGQESGRTPCPAADSSNYTPAQTWNGTALVDVAPAVSSPVKSENVSACYATVQYTASKGKGSRICHYAAGKYESNCNGETILTCDSGHWLANQNDTDCSEVGKKHYSAQYVTTREDCPLYGTAYEARLDTETTTDAVVTKCMLNGVWKNVSHGGSTSRCHYVVATDDYSENCDSYTIRVCDAGYWDERQGAISEYAVGCVAVGDGYYSPAQSSCTGEPAQPIDILGCSTQRTACPGVDKYAGTVATDIASNAPATGTTTAASATACYLDCVAEKHTGGATQTVNNSPVHFNVTTNKYALCTYDIEGCGQGYELVGGECEACVRENALSYKDTGDCSVESCVIGYHPNNDQCEPDILDCTPQAPHATYAEQKWVASRGAYGICTIKSCEEGYHLASNACVLDEQVCEIEHGTGMKVWNYTTKSWGPCIATSCAAGYTNDPIEKNNASQQCSECRNKFSTLGEVAAQAYITGCEIASCFYQGEKYNLDNNECVPICDQPYSDETGSLRWNERTKKCERTCNPGYVSW